MTNIVQAPNINHHEDVIWSHKNMKKKYINYFNYFMVLIMTLVQTCRHHGPCRLHALFLATLIYCTYSSSRRRGCAVLLKITSLNKSWVCFAFYIQRQSVSTLGRDCCYGHLIVIPPLGKKDIDRLMWSRPLSEGILRFLGDDFSGI